MAHTPESEQKYYGITLDIMVDFENQCMFLYDRLDNGYFINGCDVKELYNYLHEVHDHYQAEILLDELIKFEPFLKQEC